MARRFTRTRQSIAGSRQNLRMTSAQDDTSRQREVLSDLTWLTFKIV